MFDWRPRLFVKVRSNCNERFECNERVECDGRVNTLTGSCHERLM